MKFIPEPARTLQELTIYPCKVPVGLDPKKVSLRTPIAAYKKREEESRLYLNIPFMGAIMQALAGPKLLAGISLRGGCGFTPSSIPIDDMMELYSGVKRFKAGFVDEFASVQEEVNVGGVIEKQRLEDILKKCVESGFSTFPILNGRKLVGIMTDDDYWTDDNPRTILSEKMTKFQPYDSPLDIKKVNEIAEEMHQLRKQQRWDEIEKLECSTDYAGIKRLVKSAPFTYGIEGITLKGANLLLRISGRSCIPIVDASHNLMSLVFKKDYQAHADNPLEATDKNNSPLVGVGLNTWDYKDRVRVAVNNGGAVLFCFDSSHVNDYQLEAIRWCKKNHPDAVFGGGNLISASAFLDLANVGADFVKPGIGGGSICITREQQAVGVGQATAVMDVVNARDEYFLRERIYVPVISDGGIVFDHDILIALALGADAVMMGRYFARTTEEHPWDPVPIRGVPHNPYWGEGSKRAMNWRRYGSEDNFIEQGVDGVVPRMGPLKGIVEESLMKLRKTMVDYLGSLTLEEFTEKAIVRPGSPAAMAEGGAHDVLLRSDIGLGDSTYSAQAWGVHK